MAKPRIMDVPAYKPPAAISDTGLLGRAKSGKTTIKDLPLYFIPGVGQLLSVQGMLGAGGRGDYGGALLESLGLLPGAVTSKALSGLGKATNKIKNVGTSQAAKVAAAESSDAAYRNQMFLKRLEEAKTKPFSPPSQAVYTPKATSVKNYTPAAPPAATSSSFNATRQRPTQLTPELNDNVARAMAEYISRPLSLHASFGKGNRELFDDYFRLSGNTVPAGTPLTRVASTQDMQILENLKPGDTRVLDRYLSVTDPKDTDFINRLLNGTADTGSRDSMGRGSFPQMNFELASDVPGVFDMNPMVRQIMGDQAGSGVVDGLLARGLSMRLDSITKGQHPRFDQPDVMDFHDIYNFQVGRGMNATDGFMTKYYDDIETARLKEWLADYTAKGGVGEAPRKIYTPVMEDFPKY
jgi:hypothetical protein